MSRAIVRGSEPIRQLDRLREPDEQLTEEDLEPARLTRRLMAMLRDARLMRRWSPRTVDHRDREVDDTGTLVHRFPHGFGGRVNWWVIDWVGGVTPLLARDASTDDNTLCLTSQEIGTVSIRIEESG